MSEWGGGQGHTGGRQQPGRLEISQPVHLPSCCHCVPLACPPDFLPAYLPAHLPPPPPTPPHPTHPTHPTPHRPHLPPAQLRQPAQALRAPGSLPLRPPRTSGAGGCGNIKWGRRAACRCCHLARRQPGCMFELPSWLMQPVCLPARTPPRLSAVFGQLFRRPGWRASAAG